MTPLHGHEHGCWLALLRRYLLAVFGGNLLWEFAQLPLYAIWQTGSGRQIVFAAAHCTGGDVLIAGAAMIGALMIAGDRRWPLASYRRVAVLAITAGFGYTIFSEWLNTAVRGTWAYSERMPTLPLIGSGLAPLAQWLVVPSLAFWWAHRALRDGRRGRRR